MEHPSAETLKRFASGTPSREESRTVVAHLLKGCAECRRKLNRLMEPEPVAAHAYDAAFDRLDLDSLEASVEPDEVLRGDRRSPDPALPNGERKT